MCPRSHPPRPRCAAARSRPVRRRPSGPTCAGTGGRESVLALALFAGQQPAYRESLFTQAMAFLQQQQAFSGQGGDRDGCLVGRRWCGGRATRNSSRATGSASAPPQSQGSASSSTSSRLAFRRSTRRAVVSSRRNNRKLGKAARSSRHQLRQQERADGGNDAKPQRTAHWGAGDIGGFGDRFQRGEGGTGTLDQVEAKRSEHHMPARVAVEDLRVELAFQVRMPADNVDCVTEQASAARPKWRDSARATR